MERLESRDLLAVTQPTGIIWDPSPNFNGRGGTDIDSVVIHTTEGSYSGAVSWMKNPASEVSATYIISPAGEIRQLVTDANRAWHATYYNSRSIGIEMAGWAADPATWNSTNLGRLTHLVAWLAQQYNVPIVRPSGVATDFPNDQMNAPGILAHAQIQPWNRSDPGPHFPWTTFIQDVASFGNTAPTAGNNAYSTAEDTPLVVAASGVLTNDSDLDGGSLTAVMATPPANGTVTLNSNGSFTYTPALDFHGTDTFTYRARDASLESNTATVTITVTPINDGPYANADRFSIDEDTTLTVGMATVALTLIPTGATWRYLDNGSDQGTAWRTRDFNDAAWIAGPAQLGYGENDEATTVGFGSSTTAKYVTTYFRHAFEVRDAEQVTSLVMRLKRDDGAAVYLNGVRVVLDGLPASADFDDLATNAVDDGQGFITFPLPEATLLDGTNVVAVEIHQATRDSTDVSFDLELTGVRRTGLLGNDRDPEENPFTMTIDQPPRYGSLVATPDGGFSYTPNANYFGPDLFTYRASDGIATSLPGVVSIQVRPREDAVIAVPDRYVIPHGGSLHANTLVETTQSLVVSGAAWRFLDNGSDQGTAWREPVFNDSFWRSGPGQLGYGDSDEMTVVGFGSDAASKPVTTYFRHAFTVADPAALAALSMRLLRDDGAAVYLNGTEIYRTTNLAVTAAFDDLADLNGAAAIGDAEEAVYLSVPNINPALLVAGTNVLAVEIHQHARSSSDISFDLELSAQRRRSGVLANDQDADGAMQSLLVDAPDHGVLSLTANGALIYRPTAGFHGEDSLTYRVVDPRAVLSPTGADWRYLDNGTNVGTAWRAVGYDDSAWPMGTAQFGYGEGDETTGVAWGASAGARRVTTYFRREFTVADVSRVQFVTLRLMRDDGAAVYLNGEEIVRSNLAADAEFDDLATNADDDGQTFFEYFVSTARLRSGVNTLAVEVHQSSITSSDISFDMELVATVSSLPVMVTFDVLPMSGDANRDGRVDRSDLSVVAQNLGRVSDAVWGDGDFDGNGRVNLADLQVVQANYGRMVAGSPESVVTIENALPSRSGLGARRLIASRGAPGAGAIVAEGDGANVIKRSSMRAVRVVRAVEVDAIVSTE